jgi:hypothetical protein
MKRRSIWRLLVMVGALLGGGAWIGSVALAMHEVNHRLTIYGSVRDAKGQPISDARVIVSATRLGEGATAFTDRQGYYESTLHIHDTDLGEPIDVSTGDETKRIAAQFNPQDTTTERRMEVDFGPVAVSASGAGGARGVQPRQLWIGAGVVLVVLAGMFVMMYTRKQTVRARRGRSQKKRRG